MTSRLLPTGVLFLLIAAIPLAAQPRDPPKKAAADRETVVIKGQTYYLVPPETLRARHFDPPDIPRDRNAFWTYVDAINSMRQLPDDLQAAFDQAQAGNWPEGEAGQRLAAWLKENNSAIDLTRQATAKPDYYMPWMTAGEEEVAITTLLLPNLAPQRLLARMLAVEGTYLQAQGQADAALENYLTMQRMGNHLGNGQTMIESLVGIAVGNLAEQGFMRVSESGSASPQAMQSAVAELERLSTSSLNWERMIESERRFGEGYVDDLIESSPRSWIVGVDGMSPSGRQSEPTGWSELARRLKRLYLPDRAVKDQLRHHYDVMAKAGKPREDGTVVMLDEEDLFRRIPVWNAPARMALPSFSRVFELVLMARGNLERAKLSLAINRYRAEHGQVPSSLSALAPQYVASIPPDPMTGYDFEYQPDAAAKSGYKGLERVTRDNEAELQKKRKAPAILSPRASRWRRYVESVCDRYSFTDAQRASAEAILREMESRAAQYEQVHGAKLKELIEAGQSSELTDKMGPLDQMFGEIKQRLEALPDAKQRAAAEKSAQDNRP